MKKLFLIFCAFQFSLIQAQEKKVYKYYLHLNDYHNAHTFDEINGKMYYNGINKIDRDFFNSYEIINYIQAFEYGIDIEVKNIFYLETLNNNLIVDLLKKFPQIYLKAEDITDWKIELLKDDYSIINPLLNSNSIVNNKTSNNSIITNYYPNDYGTSSPNPNLGFNYANKAYDYINVPKAWGILYNQPNSLQNIKIGISDSSIDYLDAEFLNKITPIDGYNLQSYPNSHGTGVAAIAAAHGNNAYGNVGVCMDCNIVAGPFGIGSQILYSNLYKFFLKGAKIINMSWTHSGYVNIDKNSSYYNPGNYPISAEQLVINDIVNNFGVTLVAAAGNKGSFQTPLSNDNLNCNPPYGILSVFPASYENVISVSSIRYYNEIVLPLNQNQSSYLGTSPYFDIYQDLENSLAWLSGATDPNNPIGIITHGWYQHACNIDGWYNNHTLNQDVDLVAPGSQMFWLGNINSSNPSQATQESGTSLAAPLVTGTIGLMLSLNDCLHPNETEDILQLTSMSIENLPINQNFVGYSGSGKLETGDAVEFVYEAMRTNGNALIDGQDFWRFNFDLQHINNKLTISNQIFRDQNTSNFVAKNSIEVLKNSDFKPNNLGFVDLKIKSDLVLCKTTLPKFSGNKEKKQDNFKENSSSTIKLYPNPNNGSFSINIGDYKAIETSVIIFDIYGKQVYNSINKEQNIDINVEYLQSGIYLVKINSIEFNEIIKFIKK